jgi:ATP-binding cassette subfamily C (CFTR/MRP) protein 1
MLLEGSEKRQYFVLEYQTIGPEESSGMFGQSILWWLHSIIMLGGRKILKPTDMYPISRDMAAEELGTTFWKFWTSSSPNSARSSVEIAMEHRNLSKVLYSLFRGPVLVSVLPRLSLIAFSFCQAFLLKRLLGFLTSTTERQDARIGIGLVGAYAITYLGIAVRK